MNIYEFGWSDNITNEKINNLNLARITAVHRSVCQAITTEGEINVYLSGSSQADSSLKLVTGDFIQISPRFIDEQNKPAAIMEKIFPRQSKFSRIAPRGGVTEQILVSNLNYVFIVTSANEEFNLNRLQRYILLAKQGSVTPVVILSKIDLIETTESLINEIQERIKDIKILSVSSINEIGFEPLLQLLQPGVTAAFVGSSGVGKSTIVNRLMHQEVQKTLDIREGDGKGRHTTTSRELFFLRNGGMIIDTAGLREIQIFAEENTINEAFKKITDLINNCRFSNCTHQAEPGCQIINALENDQLTDDDFQSFLKMQKEALYNEKKIHKATSTNDKRRWKKINQDMRARQKFKARN